MPDQLQAASTLSISLSKTLSVVAIGKGCGNERAVIWAVSYPQTMAEPSAWGRTSSTEVAADSRVLIGCSIQVCHWPGAAGA